MLEAAPVDSSTTVHVIDYRRRNLMLRWHALGGTWTACEFPPPLVHGVALISALGPNICVYGQGGRLMLQIGPAQYALEEKSPRISCRGGWILFGLRRRFLVKSSNGRILFSCRYWRGHGRDFFHWLARHASNPGWRNESGKTWSDGMAPAELSRSLSRSLSG
jgi:hypothetical protein